MLALFLGGWRPSGRTDHLICDVQSLMLRRGDDQVRVGHTMICFFAISWSAPMAYGGSQARGPIGAVAAGLRQSHSNTGSEQFLNN